MDKTTDTAKSPANDRKAWIKPEVVDVDGSAGVIESVTGPVFEVSTSTS